MARMPYTAPAGIKSAYAAASEGRNSSADPTETKTSATDAGHAPPICCVRTPKG